MEKRQILILVEDHSEVHYGEPRILKLKPEFWGEKDTINQMTKETRMEKFVTIHKAIFFKK